MNSHLPKLGKLPKREDPRTLKLSAYVDEAKALTVLPRLKPLDLRDAPVAVPMYDNDKLGDCGPAGMAHAVNAWRGAVAKPATVPVLPLQAVIDFYVAVTSAQGAPFDPATGANDTGVVLLDMLKVAAKHGIGGHRIGAYVDVDIRPTSPLYDWAACAFGGLILGLALPSIVQDMRQWTFTPPVKLAGPYMPGSWGGHCVFEDVNNQVGGRGVETWGREMGVSKAFDDVYRDEAWACLSVDQMHGSIDAISGLALADLRSDLKKVRAQG